MSFTINKVISTDFTALTDPVPDSSDLRDEINTAISTAVLGAVVCDVTGDSCDLIFDVEPSVGDKTTIDGIVTAHVRPPPNEALHVDPTERTIVAGAVDVDARENNTHSLTQLVANTTVTFLNGVDGSAGTIAVRQDGVGGRTLSFVAAGRTLRKDVGATDLNPAAGIDAETMYAYCFFTVDAVAYLMIAKTELDAVV